ncbi:MAG: hypothetical protein ACXIVF_04725 [Rhizobiaceae bacterium]
MPTRSSIQHPKPRAAEDRNPNNSPSWFRPMWLCIALGLLVVVALFWFAGVTWWTLGLAVIVLGCPLVIIWVLLGGFDR